MTQCGLRGRAQHQIPRRASPPSSPRARRRREPGLPRRSHHVTPEMRCAVRGGPPRPTPIPSPGWTREALRHFSISPATRGGAGSRGWSFSLVSASGRPRAAILWRRSALLPNLARPVIFRLSRGSKPLHFRAAGIDDRQPSSQRTWRDAGDSAVDLLRRRTAGQRLSGPRPARVEPVEDLRIPAQVGRPLNPWLWAVTPPHGQPILRFGHPMRISQAPQSHPPRTEVGLKPGAPWGKRRRRVYGRREGAGRTSRRRVARLVNGLLIFCVVPGGRRPDRDPLALPQIHSAKLCE